MNAIASAARETGGEAWATSDVDSENDSGALRPYRACGFEVLAESAVYRKTLEG